MPATVKMFSAMTLLPRPWLSAVGSDRHQGQGNIVVLAFTKKETAAILTDRGVHQMAADAVTRALRTARGTFVDMLVAAGVIDPDMPGVYVYYSAIKDHPIGKVQFDGTVEIVAHFRYDGGFHGRGMWIEPVTI